MAITEHKALKLKPIGFNNEKLSLNDGFIHSTMNKLTLNSQKSWLYLVYRSFYKLKQKDSFDIPVKDLTTYLQIDTRNYSYLNDCLKSIRRTYITYNITSKDDSNWIESPLLADVGIINGNIVYSFSPFMREKLQDPKFFTVLNLTLISNFKSKYSLAIYRQLASYIIKNQSTTQKKYTLEELKYYLQIEEGYSEFRLFNNKVLKPAIEEINDFSPLSVEVEFKRQNRKVSEVKFIFSLKKDLNVNDVIENNPIKKISNNENTNLSEKINSFCIDNNFPLALVDKYKQVSYDYSISESEYYNYFEFIIDITSNMKKGFNKAGTLTNSLKDGRFVNEFKNRFSKPISKEDKMDQEMKKIIDSETESFIRTQYDKYLEQNNNDSLDYITFKANFEKNKSDELTKFKKVIFHTRCGSIYGTSPYLVKTTILKRLGL